MKTGSIKRISLIILLIIACPHFMSYAYGSAESGLQSVQDRRLEQIKRIADGKVPEEGQEEWRKICKRYKDVPVPKDDNLTAEITASVGNESEAYELYYGFDKLAEPTKARLCAYKEMELGQDGPFSGIGILMTIYANGMGAGRNLPLAIKFACQLEGAPAEMEYRVTHLEELRRKNWKGSDFSVCDDITSGLMQGVCAGHLERFEEVKRSETIKMIQSKWSEKDMCAFASLRKAADRYFNTRVEYEVDQSGTARVAMAVEEEAALEEEFLVILKNLDRKGLPSSSKQQFNEFDSKLNAVYYKLQKTKDMSIWGTVTKEGIRDTQREWIKYRDAWVAFCRIKYPDVTQSSIETFLTAIRIEMLKEF